MGYIVNVYQSNTNIIVQEVYRKHWKNLCQMLCQSKSSHFYSVFSLVFINILFLNTLFNVYASDGQWKDYGLYI